VAWNPEDDHEELFAIDLDAPGTLVRRSLPASTLDPNVEVCPPKWDAYVDAGRALAFLESHAVRWSKGDVWRDYAMTPIAGTNLFAVRGIVLEQNSR
jgi:hypothetical protein